MFSIFCVQNNLSERLPSLQTEKQHLNLRSRIVSDNLHHHLYVKKVFWTEHDDENANKVYWASFCLKSKKPTLWTNTHRVEKTTGKIEVVGGKRERAIYSKRLIVPVDWIESIASTIDIEEAYFRIVLVQ